MFFNLRKSRLQSLLSLNPLSLQLYLIENLIMYVFFFQMDRMELKKSMGDWAFAPEQHLASLPWDAEKGNFIRRDVPGAIFSEVFPTPFQSKPRMVCVR